MEATRFEQRPDMSDSHGGGLEYTPLGAALSSVGFTVPEINFIVNADYRVANLKICIDGQGNLQGTPEDCELLMRIIIDRLRPELACNFFLACPFVAKKWIVEQPWFLTLKGPETVDEKKDFSFQLGLSITTAQNHNEEVPREMVTGAAYPDWVMENGFKEAYDEFCHHQNILNNHREGQEPTEPAYSEEESSSLQGGNEPAVVSGYMPKNASPSVGKNDPENNAVPVDFNEDFALAADSFAAQYKQCKALDDSARAKFKENFDYVIDPYNKQNHDLPKSLKKKAFLKLGNVPADPSAFKCSFTLAGRAAPFCKKFAVAQPACLQFLFAMMKESDTKVQQQMEAALRKLNMGFLLLKTVKSMSPFQLEDFKSFGSLGVAKKILEVLDQNNQEERDCFEKAIQLMHFSKAEIETLVLDEIEPNSVQKCVVM